MLQERRGGYLRFGQITVLFFLTYPSSSLRILQPLDHNRVGWNFICDAQRKTANETICGGSTWSLTTAI